MVFILRESAELYITLDGKPNKRQKKTDYKTKEQRRCATVYIML